MRKLNMIQIEEIDINLLKPAEYNPRKASKAQWDELQKSLLEYGFVEPVVVNKASGRENVIIGGHFRVEVAKKMGISKVPVVYLEIPDINKEKELNLRLNKNTGEWDWDLLANLEKELLEQVGFDKYDLNEIFDLLLKKEEAIEETQPGNKQIILDFDTQEEMDKGEESIKKLGFKYHVSC